MDQVLQSREMAYFVAQSVGPSVCALMNLKTTHEIENVLSRATYHRAPRYGGVRTRVEGLLARGNHALAEASNLVGYKKLFEILLGQCFHQILGLYVIRFSRQSVYRQTHTHRRDQFYCPSSPHTASS